MNSDEPLRRHVGHAHEAHNPRATNPSHLEKAILVEMQDCIICHPDPTEAPTQPRRWALSLDTVKYDTDRTIKITAVYPAYEIEAVCDDNPYDPKHADPIRCLIWTDNVDMTYHGCRDCLAKPDGYYRIVGADELDYWNIDYPDHQAR